MSYYSKFIIICFSLTVFICSTVYSSPVHSVTTALVSQGTTIDADRYTITPLIHSASLTFFEYNESDVLRIEYKASTETHWRPAHEFIWDSVNFAFTTSMVHLQASTDYDVRLTVDSADSTEVHYLHFLTRVDYPALAPTVLYLEDFYTGGSIDLEQFVSSGTPEAYTVIDGRNVVIEGDEDSTFAVSIGALEYVLLKNITIEHAARFGIFASNASNIWIDNCRISGFGRSPTVYRDGLGYEDETSTNPINYDAGIYLQRSGVVTVENCEIFSPNMGANNWSYGHPNGSSALLVNAKHNNPSLQGQYIIRNNRFYGSEDKRFNDVIESRSNVSRTGGFIRDSAIYGNYLAYANDDILELDGGQHNVLVYDNEITQGYCGISLAPNMHGPSFIFNNTIHDLGDDRDSKWAAFKMGGLFAAPEGQSFLYHNLVYTGGNGIAPGRIRGDSTFWVNSQNNIYAISGFNGSNRGYPSYDREAYTGNHYSNDAVINLTTGNIELYLDDMYEKLHPLSGNLEAINRLIEQDNVILDIEGNDVIPNFSRLQSDDSNIELSVIQGAEQLISYGSQDEDNDHFVSDSSLFLRGNTWLEFPLPSEVSSNDSLSLSYEISVLGEMPEIVGFAFENDTDPSRSRTIQLAGTQNYGDRSLYSNSTSLRGTIDVSNFIDNAFTSLVLILDNDRNLESTLKIEKLSLAFEADSISPNPDDSHKKVLIGSNLATSHL
uniref:right-handed parallel beta-helix repeat-containing protein n=1 Tax=Ningiella ruwaisensis TaxID=2364274 RepID=UPI00109FF79D|nr:right-handed parallel beta-helix repeat-containing protein [Ningiella ruwaisensis]